MDDRTLAYTDRMAAFYAREYGFPPVAGRVLGYLLVCQPPQQTIAQLAEGLLASRSAIVGAVDLLAGHHAVRRTRSAGQRADYIGLDPRALEPSGFEGATYRRQAELAREALRLLDEGETQRRSIIEEAAAFYDFMAERMPRLLDEWHAQRVRLREHD
ncbi:MULTISPECIES: GbsR/MarR family transcriptional regulator [Streptomyces]|uniref:MarR family transcriptional regulator n=1 Tax=Streptomyces siderophoricus TaxID=2802281 RepID=A0ABS1MWA4_9ACTN|nr:MarR family transcriptional regulator [Streptomyces sp. 9-7]MBL1092023.1 hypothetical protein [Streptomyces sp. 9-7]